MNAHHTIPTQYCFALDFKNYSEQIVHYANMSVLYYQFTTSTLDKTIVIADGCADFQFCCDSKQQSAILWGSVVTPTNISYESNKTYCGIRVSTSISRRIACLAYAEVIDKGIPFSDVFKFDPFMLDGLCEADDFLARIKILENWLIKSGALNDAKTDMIDHCIDTIINSHGTMRIADMAGEIGISERLLRKKFNQSIGMSPKQYSRIVRFQDIISDVLYRGEFQKNHLEDFMDFSYYDDSHLIKDFKYFTQMTPSWFVKKMLDVNMTRYASSTSGN
ncbi:hypothetical protein DN730_00940 [Marinomonas piezotolerans]|uniref:HTH araC/xylS-type domain-containing protein n=1 Tax=Marinomonas piezotolerans TaxID=2213058 RepID=A0A370UCY0_9GAMM|nr:AraC family transcriptional regulator [Marinomonas piezotolerans]RDL45650.1 hypothetical protein DN730_00940 [Marinomonas piezotolerans]